MSDEDFRWLLIDSCGTVATLAVGRGAEVLATADLAGRGFSGEWPAALRQLLVDVGWSVGEVQCVGVVHGPGSFTGVRVGLAAAKGLCEAVGAKLIAVSRLEVLAAMGEVAVLDAGRGEFYVRRGDDEVLLTREELMEVAGEMVSVDAVTGARVVELGAVSALPIVLQRWRDGVFDDVAAVDANYVRGERDIYARKNVVSGSGS